MKYTEIPEPMRNALGTFEMLRRLGFESKDIYWDMQPDTMMQVVLRTQGKQFAIDVGFLHMTKAKFKTKWTAVMDALTAGQIPENDYWRLFQECEAYRLTDDMVEAMKRKGIRVPMMEN
jgi:hypothetical protein